MATQQPQQPVAFNKNCCIYPVAIFIVMVICMAVLCRPAPDKYTEQQYSDFLITFQDFMANNGFYANTNYTIEFFSKDHKSIRLTLNNMPATKRQYDDMAKALASTYQQWFPLNESLYVIIKDYQSMETVYTNMYSW